MLRGPAPETARDWSGGGWGPSGRGRAVRRAAHGGGARGRTPCAFAGCGSLPRLACGMKRSGARRRSLRAAPRRLPPTLALVLGKRSRQMTELVTRRIPGLRHIPVVRLVAIAEIVLVAHDHMTRLEPQERRRILQLVRIGRGRPQRLSEAQREELRELLAKAEPRLFVGEVAEKLSPVKLPGRIVRGRPKR